MDKRLTLALLIASMILLVMIIIYGEDLIVIRPASQTDATQTQHDLPSPSRSTR
jgi:hypothetical protein